MSGRGPRARTLRCVVAGGLLWGAAGCVERSLTIRTDPPGAYVYLNDAYKGESPLTQEFHWYGTYRVMVRKEGYARVEDHKLLRAPIYLWIPFDLIAELLPMRIHDERTWSYTLEPLEALPMPTPPAVGAEKAVPEQRPTTDATK